MVLFNRLALAPLDGTGIDTFFRTAEDVAGRVLRSPISPMAGVDLTRAELQPTEEGARLTLLAPGFGPEHVEVSVKRDRVTLKGERTGDRAHRFERSFRLPFPIDADAAVAKVQHGVIEVSLPRHASDAPRAIRIEGASPTPLDVDTDAPADEGETA